MDKRTYYRQQSVVDHYDQWRFGSPGGRHVDGVEKATLLALVGDLDREGPVLDLPCGTGRLIQALRGDGFRSVTGADASPAMLQMARKAVPDAALVETDAFATGFADGAFDLVCSLRFMFHLDRPGAYLAEVARILKPGGHFVCDTLRWTPRGLVPPLDRRLGGRLYCQRHRQMADLLAQNGMAIVATTRVLGLPSLAYRFLPGLLLGPVRWLDGHLPGWLLTKEFVLAVKR